MHSLMKEWIDYTRDRLGLSEYYLNKSDFRCKYDAVSGTNYLLTISGSQGI
ncbi:hypothetical protein [Jeotgalibacillus soli]|uniref:hypothetical protein n=1 Tax=Jeotgalibacillus soli TaxID=889306 RepID=UPI0012FEEFE8|nr:hypothetical protein [Jeotgalibacillus soli]